MKPIYNQFWNESYHKGCNFDKIPYRDQVSPDARNAVYIQFYPQS